MVSQSNLRFTKRSAPAAPDAGQLGLYFDANGEPQILDDAGTSTPLRQTTLSNITDAGDIASQDASAVAVTGGSVKATTGLGYNTGAGGTVTQTSNKSTSVTCDAYVCFITMASASLAGDTTVTFTLNNNKVAANDQLVASHHSGGTHGSYNLAARATGAGTASVSVRNITGGSLSEAIVLMVTVIKGANS